MDVILTRRFASPIGEITLGAYKGRLCLADFIDGRRHADNITRITHHQCATFQKRQAEVLDLAAKQLKQHFTRTSNTPAVPLLTGGTSFQKRAWSELLRVPYGNTTNYGTIAKQIGLPYAVRTVALAFGKNALSLFIPFHHIIPVNGGLGQYAGGTPAKYYLLLLKSYETTISCYRSHDRQTSYGLD